jgi:hypothetical protein
MLRPCLFVVFGACAASSVSARAASFRQDAPAEQGEGAARKGQGEAPNDIVELRITLVRGSSVVVDRGSADLLRVGDRVFFRPKEGGLHGGIVSQVDERTATVDLQALSFPAAPGVRGFVRIPTSRSAEKAAERRKPRTAPTGDEEHPGWQNGDEEYQQGQPLLARVRPVRPEERPRDYSGRWYTTLDQIRSTEDDRTDAFYRVGGSLRVDNLTGDGDRLSLDGELNYRDTSVPDDDDQNTSRLRVDRASYSWGGTRFEPQRVEFGRFLHYGLPEFGVIDGAEWTTRTASGDRYGFSAGWQPEPNYEYESGRDFAVSAFYRWVHDDSERLSAAAGFQKSWHNSAADRDLAVFNLDYLPGERWSFFSSAWVDFYTSGDDLKGAGPELTQFLANLTHNWSADTSLGVRASHISFPQIDRFEFNPLPVGDLADARVDRVAAFARTALTKTWRVRVEAGVWSDEDDSGGDFELSQELDGFLLENGVVGASVFAVSGQFSDAIGARAWLRSWGERGGWTLEYELANNDIVGFTSQNDDLPQHRARAQWDFISSGAWSVRAQLDAMLWDDEGSLLAGLHINRTF